MAIGQFTRLKVGTGLTGTDFGGGVLELAASAVRLFFAQQHGPLPASPESSGMYRVPYLAGAVVEYTLEWASLHLGEAGSTATTLVIEKSETTDEFTPITIATLSLGSGVFLDEETSGLGTIESGNLLRFTWTAIGTGADMFHAQLEGTET